MDEAPAPFHPQPDQPPHEDSLAQREKNIAGYAGLTLEALHDRLSRVEQAVFGEPGEAQSGNSFNAKPAS